MTDERTNELAYRRIDSATHENGTLRVRFANGDEVGVKTAKLLPQGLMAPDWDALVCDGVEIEVPSRRGPQHVFWETIRELTDPAYAVRLKQADAAYRLRTGQQIRNLRVRRGLAGNYVAAQAGINNQSLSRIERGHRGVTLTTLRRILNAMGYTLQDMVIDPETGEESSTPVGAAAR